MTIAYGAGDALIRNPIDRFAMRISASLRRRAGVSLGALSVDELRLRRVRNPALVRSLSRQDDRAKTIAPATFVGSAIVWSACLSILDSVFGKV